MSFYAFTLAYHHRDKVNKHHAPSGCYFRNKLRVERRGIRFSVKGPGLESSVAVSNLLSNVLSLYARFTHMYA